jgi:uncharacterized protein (TIGR01777 family)
MNILITGGTGLVGGRLTELLLKKGHKVGYLSRSPKTIPNINVYQWNVNKQTIDNEAIKWADAIINLAGASVAESLWTEKYKKEIYDSRVLGTRLLATSLQNTPHKVKVFVQASAVGIYGLDTQAAWLTEDARQGTDFLATVTADWEKETQLIEKMNIRTALLRIGVVLSTKGGALPKLALPVKLFVGAAIGTGKQYISWIHIDDLCQLFISCVENENYQGVYNAAAPNPVTNSQITQSIAKALKRPFFLPNVPAFVLKMGMGEMANIVLGGNRVSVKKISQVGFQFQFPDLENALKDLL